MLEYILGVLSESTSRSAQCLKRRQLVFLVWRTKKTDFLSMATAELPRFMSVLRPMPSIKTNCSMRLGSTCGVVRRWEHRYEGKSERLDVQLPPLPTFVQFQHPCCHQELMLQCVCDKKTIQDAIADDTNKLHEST